MSGLADRSLQEAMLSAASLVGSPLAFDTDSAPADPLVLLDTWLRDAVAAGVAEPRAMTLATVDVHGDPSARVLILRDVTPDGLVFATDGRSGKVRDLEVRARAAVTLWWQPVVRQVRARGSVRRLPDADSARDFLVRSPDTRAAALASRPGEMLHARRELVEAIVQARARIEDEPGLVLEDWQAWVVEPDEVEFWQGDPDRAHTRLVYRREDDGRWSRGLRWP